MQTSLIFYVVALLIALFVSSSHEYLSNDELKEAVDILSQLENPDQGLNVDRKTVDYCEGLCDPEDECNCILDDCVPENCNEERALDERGDGKPVEKRFWGRIRNRFCRNRRLRYLCRIGKK